MKKVQKFLFYLLILLLPTQLGRHFFFDFSQVSGITIDYLVPTVYLTDIIVAIIVASVIPDLIRDPYKWIPAFAGMTKKSKKLKAQNSKLKATTQSSKLRNPYLKNKYFLFTIFYLLFTAVFIAANKWIALYKLVKIIEFTLLGLVIVRLKPDLFITLLILCSDTIYTSVIAVWQFVLQRSIGGFFWWLGERSFYVSTPGIARFSFGGRLLLRPYATFPHPNVMAGFLAVVLPIFLSLSCEVLRDPPNRRGGDDSSEARRRIFFFLTFLSGLFTLLLSFSRAAWTVAFIGFILVVFRKLKIFKWLKKHYAGTILIFYILFILSVGLPLVLSKTFSLKYQSLRERAELIEGSLRMVLANPLFGTGLNNSIAKVHNFINNASGFYIFQPVHNVYLLVLVETGLIGFILFITTLIFIYRAALSKSFIVTLALVQVFLLGFFDHYFFTLQQAQLLFTIFASFALSKIEGLALSKAKALVLPDRKS